jgi:hypothetical protein
MRYSYNDGSMRRKGFSLLVMLMLVTFITITTTMMVGVHAAGGHKRVRLSGITIPRHFWGKASSWTTNDLLNMANRFDSLNRY